MDALERGPAGGPRPAAAFDGGVAAGDLELRPATRDDMAHVLAMAPAKIDGKLVSTADRRRLVSMMIDARQVVVARIGEDVVGLVNLARHPAGMVEIGWAVMPGLEGRGHGTRIARTAIDHMLESAGERVQCTVETGNAASLRIAEKLGLASARTWMPGTVSFAAEPPVPARRI